MTLFNRLILPFLLSSLSLLGQENSCVLWYKAPARIWEESLPLGNGRLGASVWGGIDRERITLNEETIWSFRDQPVQISNAHQFVHKKRVKVALEGKYKEIREVTPENADIPADARIETKVVEGLRAGSPVYQPLADLYLFFTLGDSIPIDYRRELDIGTALSSVAYKVDGVAYKRELFVSHPDQAVVLRISADQPGKVSFSGKLSRRTDAREDSYRFGTTMEFQQLENMPAQFPTRSRVLGDDTLSFSGTTNPKGVDFDAHLRVRATGGKVFVTGEGFQVEDADEAILYFTSATSFKSRAPGAVAQAQLDHVSALPYSELLARHVQDHQRLFNRVSLDLEKSGYSKLPTDERVRNFQLGIKGEGWRENQARDNDLFALLFQYGRYLLIASSREGTLPPALLGIWNDSLMPPWTGNHTSDINVEQNYWAAESCNLAELHTVLLDFMLKHMGPLKAGTAIAYGTRGMAVGPGFSQWGFSMAGNTSWWLDFGGWISHHFWEHYAYSLDREYLEKAYPFIKETALFYLDNLIEYPGRGYLVFGPETSPENGFNYIPAGATDKILATSSLGTTMSRAIVRENLFNAIQAAQVLGLDANLVKEFKAASLRLAPYQIGKDGQLQEWLEDFEQRYPGHRHMSHLYPVYPGYEITRESAPAFFDAARSSLLGRLRNGGGWVGWSGAWALNLAARLGDSQLALRQLERAVEEQVLYNLFSCNFRAASAANVVDPDGNHGVTAGIAEMLMQSHEGYIRLLPAKPDNWRTGHIRGLRARGGFLVDVYWKNGALTKAAVTSTVGTRCQVRYGDRMVQFDTDAHGTYLLDASLELVSK